MDIIDVEPDDPALLADVVPVVQELRPHITAESFARIYAEGHSQGLRYIAAFADGQCAGVAGWRIIVNTSAVRKLYVDDLVTSANWQSRGVGAMLLAELEKRARDDGCSAFDLDSGVQRSDAHRFYMRQGMAIPSFHFAKQL